MLLYPSSPIFQARGWGMADGPFGLVELEDRPPIVAHHRGLCGFHRGRCMIVLNTAIM
jgi:hypothetical protein